MFSVYMITNTVNWKRYVGWTSDLERRWKQHRNLRSKDVPALKNAIRKYGLDNFVLKVIETCETEERAKELERRWIRVADTYVRCGNGYNLTHGGEGVCGLKHSDEARAKMSRAQKGVKKAPRSAEHRAALSRANAGKAPSAACIAASKAYLTGRSPTPLSKEARERISQKLMGHAVSAETRAIMSAKRMGRSFPMSDAGRQRHAEALKNRAKVPESAYESIFQRRDNGESIATIALSFGVSKQRIWQILKAKREMQS